MLLLSCFNWNRAASLSLGIVLNVTSYSSRRRLLIVGPVIIWETNFFLHRIPSSSADCVSQCVRLSSSCELIQDTRRDMYGLITRIDESIKSSNLYDWRAGTVICVRDVYYVSFARSLASIWLCWSLLFHEYNSNRNAIHIASIRISKNDFNVGWCNEPLIGILAKLVRSSLQTIAAHWIRRRRSWEIQYFMQTCLLNHLDFGSHIASN